MELVLSLDALGGVVKMLQRRWRIVLDAMCGALEVSTRVAEVNMSNALGESF